MKKVVIIGGGFAGLTIARKLDKKLFNITIIDRNNYHQFQPLLYQIAISGIETESICFPLRGIFGGQGVTFRMGSVISINREAKHVCTTTGDIAYDYLVIATGTTTNYYNNSRISSLGYPMKSAEDALKLRNRILANLEAATIESDMSKLERLLNIVIVGGGPTGVEVAGALADMKRYVIAREFPEINLKDVKISLIEGSDRLLGTMSQQSSDYALKSLQKMGVNVILNTFVTDYDGDVVRLNNNNSLNSGLLVWVSGVVAECLEGIPKESIGPGNRIITDVFSQLGSDESIFAIGDIAIIRSGCSFVLYPQVAPTAIQQAETLAVNIMAIETDKPLKPFSYKNKGSMATIGRNRAVADIGSLKLSGFIAWVAWLIIHLRSILGVRNKIIILINWIWSYFSYRKSIGLILFNIKK